MRVQINAIEFELRPWETTDLVSLVKYANNPKIADNLTDQFPHPYTEESGKRFLNMAMQGNPPNVLCISINGEASGGIGVHPQQDVYRMNAELGYWLAKPFWGRGIITKAITHMVDYGFSNFEFNRIYARPYGHNKASMRVLEKAGFKLEARLENTFLKNGKFLDEYIYAIRRNDA